MKMMNTIKRSSALLLIFALLFLPFAGIKANAATGVDMSKECSLAFEEGQMDAEYAELKSIPVTVRLYQVADITVSGTYTPLPGYEALELPAAGGEDATAEDWQKLAQTAAGLVTENNFTHQAELTLHSPQLSQAKIEGLALGMYLVEAQAVQSPQYEYAFTPYLISLPGNYYADTGNDSWVYDVTTRLKPGRMPRYGDLEIIKTLTSYSETFRGAFFIFEVKGEKDGKTVYSDVVSINFDRPGKKKTLVGHLPAGTQVTVTEVYSGAGYKPVLPKEQKAVIVAGEEGQDPVYVEFENEYSHHPNGGSGIVNHFQYNKGAWDVEQQADNTVAGNFLTPASPRSMRTQRGEEGQQQSLTAKQEIQTTGGGLPRQNAAAPAEAVEAVVAVADNIEPQAPEAEAFQEGPEEEIKEPDPMDKVDDAQVPLAGLVSHIFEDGNATLLPAAATGMAAVVMGVTFLGVWLKKSAGLKAKGKSALRRDKR